MEIRVVADNILKSSGVAVIIGVYEGGGNLEGETLAIDEALGGAVSELVKSGEIKGKLNQTTIIYSLGKLPAAKVLVAGLGKRDELTAEKIRGVIGNACRLLQKQNTINIVISAP